MKKFLIILSSIVLTFITFLVVIVLLISYKKDINNPKVVSDNKGVLEVINNELYNDALDINERETLPILFSEEELEYLGYALVKSIDDIDGLDFIGVNFDVKNKMYSIMVQVRFKNFFTTIAHLNLDFKKSNDGFIVTFDNVKLGRLGLTWLGKMILGAISQEEVEKDLAENGIYAKVIVSERKVIITYDDLEKTITSSLDDEASSELISLLIDIFLKKEDLLKVSFGEDDLLGVTLNVKNAKYDSSIHSKLQYEYDYSDVINKCKLLLNNKKITIDELFASFNFIVRGYNDLEDELKEVVNGIDYSDIGIITNRLYPGIISHSDLSLSSYFKDIFKDKSLIESLSLINSGILISDDFLNGILQSLPFVGFGYAFNNYDNEVGYFTIEQFLITCHDEEIVLDLVININGYHLVIEVKCDALDSEANGLTVRGVIKNVEIGTVELSASEKEKLLSYLETAMSELDWITTSPSESVIYMDFSKVLAEAISSNEVISGALSDMINDGTKVFVEEGYIKIKK